MEAPVVSGGQLHQTTDSGRQVSEHRRRQLHGLGMRERRHSGERRSGDRQLTAERRETGQEEDMRGMAPVVNSAGSDAGVWR